MKRVVFSSIFLVAAAIFFYDYLTSVFYTKAPPPVMTYNWTGCYIGGNLGGKAADTRNDVTIAGSPFTAASTLRFGRNDFDSSTFIGGGQIGCNWQAPGSNWVWGIEGDADAQRWRRTMLTAGPGLPPLFVAGDDFTLRSDWQASIRGRLGYAWDRWMLYATGGVAFTEVRADSNFIVVGAFPATLATSRKTMVGATAGVGLEYAFANNWSFGLEGRYSWYERETFGAGDVAVFLQPGAAPVFTFSPASQSVRLETLEVTARLSRDQHSTCRPLPVGERFCILISDFLTVARHVMASLSPRSELL